MSAFIADLKRRTHRPVQGGLELLKYIGPGLMVTVGFIDPGNWASNLAAGSSYGYALLWMVTLSTLMLIALQHNAAHLGIATGLCLSEAAHRHLPPALSRAALWSAMAASVATSLAEITGGALALRMLTGLPLPAGAALTAALALYLLFSNGYRRLEKWIIGFVSLIGLSFVYELALARVDWRAAASGLVTPSLPAGSMMVVVSVLGAVVMPHNIFLHSEVIQSRRWDLEDETVIRRQLRYEFADTLLSMLAGWAINGSMIVMAAATFWAARSPVTELEQARAMLGPLLGGAAGPVFAFGLLFSGLASSVTSGMAGGSITAGMYGEPLDMRDSHSRLGALVSVAGALALALLVSDPFRSLLLSQAALGVQLPFTVALQLYLTSSRKVMGRYANGPFTIAVLAAIGLAVAGLDARLLLELARG